jgi:hypothetical protein
MDNVYDNNDINSNKPTISNIGTLQKNGRNWDKPISMNIREYAYNSYALSWMTTEDSNYYSDLNDKLTFFSITIGLINTLVIATVLPIINYQIQWLMYTLIGIGIILQFVQAIATQYKHVYKLDYSSQEQSEKATKFGNLYRSIRNQFYLQKEHRYDAKTLLEFVAERFDELNREKLSIRSNTQEKWDKFHTPYNEDGSINYDKILLLPCELRHDDEQNDYVTIDFPVNIVNKRKLKFLHNERKLAKSKKINSDVI